MVPATIVFPVVTSISESVVSVLRANYNTLSCQRAKGRQRSHRKKDKSKQSVAVREEQYKRLLASLVLHADSAENGVCIPAKDYPHSLLDKFMLTDFIKREYFGDCTTDPSTSQHRRSLLHQHTKSPSIPSIMASLNVMTSINLPSCLTAPKRYLHTTRRTVPTSKSDSLTDALEGIVGARARYEQDPSLANARAVLLNERNYTVRRIFAYDKSLARQLNTLKERANRQPGNAHVQALYLTALHTSVSRGREQETILPLLNSNSFAINSVIIGLYLEASGGRPHIAERVRTERGAGFHGLREFLDVFGKLCSVALTGVILFILYNTLRGYNGRGGGIQGFLGDDKSFEVLTPDVTFKDVAGNEHVVEEMMELVSFLTDPDKYEGMGCNIPKGYLFCGPPGVGKTLMAKALAGEAGVPFYYASGSAFEEVFVGVGAGRVRKLFEDAQENAPSIIFIDEIDSIGQKRRISESGSTNRSTLNQILSCMDGFEDNNGVIVIAATNDPNILDEALMREGRFDTKISIRAPSLKGRLAMLEVHTANKMLADGVDLEYLATACVGMTGAQLATLANTAALRAVLENRDEITQDDFEYARARLLIGHINEDLELSVAELENTAAHEAGHALLTVLREEITKAPVYITTIQPRGGTLGHVLPVPKTDQHSQNIAQMIAQIDISIAGRVGEELHHDFEKDMVSTGCSSDMANATRIAEALIKQCGYSKVIGLVKSRDDNDDMTEKVVHDEIKKLFDERYQIVKSELVSRKKDWRRLTDTLVQYKTLTGGEVKAILEGGSPDRLPGEMLPSS